MRLENIRSVYGISSKKPNEQFEKIASSIEKIQSFAEKIPEKITEKIRYRGQRGADKSARRLNANSLRNLKQYQNIPVAKPNNFILCWNYLRRKYLKKKSN